MMLSHLTSRIPEHYKLKPTNLTPQIVLDTYNTIKSKYKGISQSSYSNVVTGRNEKFLVTISKEFLYMDRLLPTMVISMYKDDDLQLSEFCKDYIYKESLQFRKYINNPKSNFLTEMQNLYYSSKIKSFRDLFDSKSSSYYVNLLCNEFISPCGASIIENYIQSKYNYENTQLTYQSNKLIILADFIFKDKKSSSNLFVETIKDII